MGTQVVLKQDRNENVIYLKYFESHNNLAGQRALEGVLQACGYQPRNLSSPFEYRGLRLVGLELLSGSEQCHLAEDARNLKLHQLLQPDGELHDAFDNDDATHTPPSSSIDPWVQRLDRSWAIWNSLEATRYCYWTEYELGECNLFEEAVRVRENVPTIVAARSTTCTHYCTTCVTQTFDELELPTTSDSTHEGGRLRSISDWYQWCMDDVLRRDTRQYLVSLEFFENTGLLRLCGYRDLHKECDSDQDCFVGISITDISNNIHHCDFDPHQVDFSSALPSDGEGDDGPPDELDHTHGHSRPEEQEHGGDHGNRDDQHGMVDDQSVGEEQPDDDNSLPPVWLWILIAVSCVVLALLLLGLVSLLVKRRLQRRQGNHPYIGFETLNPDEWS